MSPPLSLGLLFLCVCVLCCTVNSNNPEWFNAICKAQAHTHSFPTHTSLNNYKLIPLCDKDITHSVLNISPQAPIWHTRKPSHPHLVQPFVVMAIVFNHSTFSHSVSAGSGPTYKLAMPMYYAERYIKKSLVARFMLLESGHVCSGSLVNPKRYHSIEYVMTRCHDIREDNPHTAPTAFTFTTT